MQQWWRRWGLRSRTEPQRWGWSSSSPRECDLQKSDAETDAGSAAAVSAHAHASCPKRHQLFSVHGEITHHCHCITGQYSTNIQNSIVGHIGEDVDDGDYGHRDGDGQRKVPAIRHQIFSCFKDSLLCLITIPTEKETQKVKLPFRVFNLLSHKVEGVPAGIREESRVERQRNITRICRRSLEGWFKVGCIT